MRTTTDLAPAQNLNLDIPQLRGSFSNNIDWPLLRTRSSKGSAAAAAVANATAAPSTSATTTNQQSHHTQKQPPKRTPRSDSQSSGLSTSTMAGHSASSDSSQVSPCWMRYQQPRDLSKARADHSGGGGGSARCSRLAQRRSSCSGSSRSPSLSKRFEFCISDSKNDCAGGGGGGGGGGGLCHRMTKHRRRRLHQRHHNQTRRRRRCELGGGGVRINACGAIPRAGGHVSFQCISKLFQPWLWRPSPPKRPTSDADSSDDEQCSDCESDSGVFLPLMLLLLLLLVLGGVLFHVAYNRDGWRDYKVDFSAPLRMFGYANHVTTNNNNNDNDGEDDVGDVMEGVAEPTACHNCKFGSEPSSFGGGTSRMLDDAKGVVALEKFLRKKAKRIISKLN